MKYPGQGLPNCGSGSGKQSWAPRGDISMNQTWSLPTDPHSRPGTLVQKPNEVPASKLLPIHLLFTQPHKLISSHDSLTALRIPRALTRNPTATSRAHRSTLNDATGALPRFINKNKPECDHLKQG